MGIYLKYNKNDVLSTKIKELVNERIRYGKFKTAE